MMFFRKKDMSIIDAIDRELIRIHSEMYIITWDDSVAPNDNTDYRLLLAEISKLNDALISILKIKKDVE